MCTPNTREIKLHTARCHERRLAWGQALTPIRFGERGVRRGRGVRVRTVEARYTVWETGGCGEEGRGREGSEVRTVNPRYTVWEEGGVGGGHHEVTVQT